MRKVLLYFIAFFCISLHAQKCKYQTDKVDKFTKQHVLKTEFKVLAKNNWSGQIVRVEGVKIDNVKFIKFYLVDRDAFFIEKDSELLLLDENEEVTTLIFPEDKISQVNVNYSPPTTFITQLFNLELGTELLEKSFTEIRYYTEQGYVQLKIKPKNKRVIKNVLDCL